MSCLLYWTMLYILLKIWYAVFSRSFHIAQCLAGAKACVWESECWPRVVKSEKGALLHRLVPEFPEALWLRKWIGVKTFEEEYTILLWACWPSSNATRVAYLSSVSTWLLLAMENRSMLRFWPTTAFCFSDRKFDAFEVFDQARAHCLFWCTH